MQIFSIRKIMDGQNVKEKTVFKGYVVIKFLFLTKLDVLMEASRHFAWDSLARGLIRGK